VSPSTVLTTAIQREILCVLGASDAMTIPAATAQVAAEWSARRRHHGHSPWSAQVAAALTYRVGADLAGPTRRRSAGSGHLSREWSAGSSPAAP
jgi:hypothetical protein